MTTRFNTALLAGAVALALGLAAPSCDCGGGPPDQDGGEDGGGDDGGGGSDGGGGNDGGGGSDGGGGESDAGPQLPTREVLEHHGGPSRSGLFVDPGLTRASVGDGGFRRNASFAGGLTGQVYAQPLYFENAAGPDLVIVATTQNTVYAFDALDGGVVWQRALPQAMSAGLLPCGNISPNHGITGTPVIDPAARALYLDANTQGPDAGARHQVFGLSLDDGSTLPGWPVDMNATVSSGATRFNSNWQGARSALSLMGGKLYVPFGGMAGDCGNYHGWVVGMPVSNPSQVTSWTTRANRAGIWAVGGLASDGTYLYGATGNAQPGAFGDQESVLRFAAGPTYSGQDQDRWTPVNWDLLDNNDTDISGSGPLPLDLPGASPSALMVQLGKDGNAYLLDRTSLGGEGGQMQTLRIASSTLIQAAATYRTPAATYFVAAGTGTGCPGGTSGDLIAVKMDVGPPPMMAMAWCARQNGRSSPIVTTTDGTNEALVWTVGTNDGRLRAFNGDTGQLLYTSTDTMSGLHAFMTLIHAKGRMYIAGDNRLYSYSR